jgi:hypothetical protein
MSEYPAAGPPTDLPSGGPTAALSLITAADLQDHLMVATNDLDRLQDLLTDACDTLLGRFYAVMDHLRAIDSGESAPQAASAAADAIQQMAGAVTALQFQDMASQLIGHTSRRLRNCADRLAREAMGDDEDGASVVETAPLRPNPVTQAEMDAGSVELF